MKSNVVVPYKSVDNLGVAVYFDCDLHISRITMVQTQILVELAVYVRDFRVDPIHEMKWLLVC